MTKDLERISQRALGRIGFRTLPSDIVREAVRGVLHREYPESKYPRCLRSRRRRFSFLVRTAESLALRRGVVVAAYIEDLTSGFEAPTVKQHLAAIRMLFDWLVIGQVVPMNPASSVRGPKHVVKRGKTPVLSAAEARELLDSIDLTELVGLRDRALVGLMVYSFARVGAAVSMDIEDYF
jgi:integrase/recombinase XerD